MPTDSNRFKGANRLVSELRCRYHCVSEFRCRVVSYRYRFGVGFAGAIGLAGVNTCDIPTYGNPGTSQYRTRATTCQMRRVPLHTAWSGTCHSKFDPLNSFERQVEVLLIATRDSGWHCARLCLSCCPVCCARRRPMDHLLAKLLLGISRLGRLRLRPSLLFQKLTDRLGSL